MKAIVLNDSFEGAPDYLQKIGYSPESQIKNIITCGKEYDVFAVAAWANKGFISICFADAYIHPHTLPSWLFSVTDATIPHDWQCHTFRNEWVSMIMGPSFISESPESFERLLEGYPEQNKMFLEYVKTYSNTYK